MRDYMKKIMLFLMLITTFVVSGTAFANNDASVNDNLNWEISMQPKPTAEELEAARWSIIVENDLGIYAYDMDSLFFVEKNGVANENEVKVLLKMVFTNKDVIKKLNEQYAAKLEKKEKIAYCKMDMQYKMAEKEYTVKTMQVFTNKDRQIDVKHNKKYAPIPEKSFAEALFEVCQQFVVNVKAAQQAQTDK